MTMDGFGWRSDADVYAQSKTITIISFTSCPHLLSSSIPSRPPTLRVPCSRQKGAFLFATTVSVNR